MVYQRIFACLTGKSRESRALESGHPVINSVVIHTFS